MNRLVWSPGFERSFKCTLKEVGIMGDSKTIECVYEGGVFRPLEKVDLVDGTRLRIKMGRSDLSKFYGILGKASAERLAELDDEGSCVINRLTFGSARK